MAGKADCVPFMFLFFLAFIRIAIPDASYDTLNYHLFWQDSFGQNIVQYHFFPTRVINSLFFCLGDRTYYIFRMLLGYRGGVFLGTLALMIIYLQGKIFLQKAYAVIVGDEPTKKYAMLISVMSLLCVLAEQILVYVDTYYVDWLALPFLIEVLLRVFFAERQENLDVYMFGVMAGVCICIKPSNAVFILLLLLCYIIRFYKNIQWHAWIYGIIFSMLVCFPYTYISYRMTDNPVFPYLNSLFKSEWFFFRGVDEYSGIKDLFGPTTLKEYILWPYYMTFQSDNVHFADYPQYCGRLLAALVMSVVSLIRVIRRKKDFFLIKVSGILICLYILYLLCLNGHLRYALFLEWYAGIALAVIVMILLKENDLKRYKVIGISICVLPILFTMRWTRDYIFNSGECVQRQSLFENKENWVQNAKYLFHDYGKADVLVMDIGGFIVFDTNGSMMSMINLDVPIVNIKSGALTEAAKRQCECILSGMKENGKVYSLSKPNQLVQLTDEIGCGGYSIESAYTIQLPTIARTNQFCYLVSVREEKKDIQVYEGKTVEEIILDSSLEGKKIHILIGRKWRDVSDQDIDLKIFVDSNEQTIEVSLNPNGEFYQYEMQLPDVINTGVKIKLDADNLLNKWVIVEYS